MFRKNPGFAATAVLCLTPGVGVNATISSALNYAMLSPLAVPGWSRVVEMTRGWDALFSYPDYQDFCDRNRNFAGLDGIRPIGNQIGNRPLGAFAAPQSRPINNRPQDAILPHFGLCRLNIDSQNAQ
jgi:hypothetical protein